MPQLQLPYAAAQIWSIRRLGLSFWLRLAFPSDTEEDPHQGAGPKDSVGMDRDPLPSERFCPGLLTALFSLRSIYLELSLVSCHRVQKRPDPQRQRKDYSACKAVNRSLVQIAILRENRYRLLL